MKYTDIYALLSHHSTKGHPHYQQWMRAFAVNRRRYLWYIDDEGWRVGR